MHRKSSRQVVFSILGLAFFILGTADAQTRRIRPGDDIEVVVYEHQELSRVVRVDEDGTVDFPFMQGMPVDGLTTREMKDLIVAQLSNYLETYPVVTVNFVKKETIKVRVLGMVERPATYELPKESTLQGAISFAGGFMPGANMQSVRVYRMVDERKVSRTFNLERFILQGDQDQNPQLQDLDEINIIGNPVFNSVKVMGQVFRPGSFENFSGATVIDVIMMAGGPSENANMKKVLLLSPSRKTQVELDLNFDAVLNTDRYTELPQVMAGDVVVIPEKRNYWRLAAGVIRDLSYVALAVYYISRASN